MYIKLPPVEKLHEIFHYVDGELYWKITHNRVKCGSVAGTTDKKGYRIVTYDGVIYKVHRIVWKMHTGLDPVGEIDHVNRNKADNNISNLRDVNKSQNLQNNNAKGFSVGKRGKFISQINIKGKTRYLGTFDTAEEANKAFKEFKELYSKMSGN